MQPTGWKARGTTDFVFFFLGKFMQNGFSSVLKDYQQKIPKPPYAPFL